MKTAFAAIAGLAIGASAFAGVVTNSGSLALYGNSYNVTTWDIRDDSNASVTPRIFGAEAMTFLNGNLYVAEDHSTNQGDGNLVIYTPGSAGDLTGSSRIAMGTGPSGQRWGPEGMTINSSGSGYGSFAPGSAARIAGIETQGTDSFGVFDTGSPGSAPTNTQPSSPSLDDIAWVGSRNQFAAIEDGAVDTSFLRFYDHSATSLTLTTFRVGVIDGAKGVATVSAAFATSLTGAGVSTAEALLVVSEFDGFAFYNTDGTPIGSALTFGSYLPITELESVAVDEANNLIFLGDEAGSAIHVLQVPAPGTAAVFGLAMLGLARRRRN